MNRGFLKFRRTLMRKSIITLLFYEEEVLAEIREALKVYGWYGMPLERQEMYISIFNRQNPNGFAEVAF